MSKKVVAPRLREAKKAYPQSAPTTDQSYLDVVIGAHGGDDSSVNLLKECITIIVRMRIPWDLPSFMMLYKNLRVNFALGIPGTSAPMNKIGDDEVLSSDELVLQIVMSAAQEERDIINNYFRSGQPPLPTPKKLYIEGIRHSLRYMWHQTFPADFAALPDKWGDELEYIYSRGQIWVSKKLTPTSHGITFTICPNSGERTSDFRSHYGPALALSKNKDGSVTPLINIDGWLQDSNNLLQNAVAREAFFRWRKVDGVPESNIQKARTLFDKCLEKQTITLSEWIVFLYTLQIYDGNVFHPACRPITNAKGKDLNPEEAVKDNRSDNYVQSQSQGLFDEMVQAQKAPLRSFNKQHMDSLAREGRAKMRTALATARKSVMLDDVLEEDLREDDILRCAYPTDESVEECLHADMPSEVLTREEVVEVDNNMLDAVTWFDENRALATSAGAKVVERPLKEYDPDNDKFRVEFVPVPTEAGARDPDNDDKLLTEEDALEQYKNSLPFKLSSLPGSPSDETLKANFEKEYGNPKNWPKGGTRKRRKNNKRYTKKQRKIKKSKKNKTNKRIKRIKGHKMSKSRKY